MDLAGFRQGAEAFVSALDREHYLHFSGQKEDYEVEPVYERHAALFSREIVEALRGAGAPALFEMAVQGLIGRELAAGAAELARREATLEIEAGGERLPFRRSAMVQANELDARRRAEIESARLAATRNELDPLLRELHERTAGLVRELGWPSTVAMVEELSGLDLGALGRETSAFLAASEEGYRPLLEPELRRRIGIGFDELRRSDLPAFFRAASLDTVFPDDGLMPALAATARGLGVELDSLPNVIVDAEARPLKSPRAFCAPVRVPDEVYLVIAPTGGRDDYATLLHEAGHALHYGHVDPALPFEHRYLGDNSVTEGFAFLLEGLVSDPEWLARRLGAADAAPDVAGFARASKLVFLRRYCAKLDYELELHGENGSTPERYARRLSAAVGVDWPEATWLADVDAFFYAARYLRAWALETHLRAHLEERFGEAWFDHPGAGEVLRGLWWEGQRSPAEELLARIGGEQLGFSRLVAELGL